jgi:predicted component of type VI protein secretion system
MARPKAAGLRKAAKAEKRVKRAEEKKKVRAQVRKQLKQAAPTKPTNTADAAKTRAKPKWKWMTRAKRDIKKQLRSALKRPAINRSAFKGMVTDICADLQTPVRWQRRAIDALLAAFEPRIVRKIAAANALAVEGTGKPTLTAHHMQCVTRVQRIMGIYEPC